jgi:hypothetical protein
MREGTTSRVMAADRPYGEIYDLQRQSGIFWIDPRTLIMEVLHGFSRTEHNDDRTDRV